jgi:4-amino-4-deoxy-L-arabinose transferase-like glycosyltransferase
MLNKMLNNKHFPFWLIAVGILIGLTVPTLIQDGMFMDAMLYTSVSHNMSMGIGSFWFPEFSVHNIAGMASFHEQPPLVFGIQSLFFRLLGDSMYVERFYVFLTTCITAFLIVLLWKEIFRNNDSLIKMGWLPVLLWITIPVCFWSYSNNMHENTMGVFTLCAVLFSYKAFQTKKHSVLLIVLSGLFIFLASFSKGIPGFFPITIPFLYWLITRKISFAKTVLYTLIITLIPFVIYLLLCIIPEGKDSLSKYFIERALHRMNEVPTVDSRFYILGRLFMELLPQLSLIVVFFVIAKLKKTEMRIPDNLRSFLFFVSVGLIASAPLMLTLVQKGFYFVPSLPFFAIGISIIIAPLIAGWVGLINTSGMKHKVFLLSSACLLLFAIVFSGMQAGKTSRDKDLLHDVYIIGTVVPKQSLVSITSDMWNNWSLQCYLMRYYNISLESSYKNEYFIWDRTIANDTLANFRKVDIATVQYDLYKRY